MALSLVTAAVALFYLGAVPVRVAVCARTGGGFGVGVAPFEFRFALRMARSRKKRRTGGASIPGGAAVSILRRIRPDCVRVEGALGTGDAAVTALVCGALGALGQALSCALRREIRLALRPDFSGRPRFEASGMFSARLGHIMYAALTGAFEYYSGRLNAWISIPSRAS